MEKKSVKITIFFNIIFIIGTISTLFIVYKDINNKMATKFVIGYLLFTFIYFLYLVVITINSIKKRKCKNIKKRLLKFLFNFSLHTIILYVLVFLFLRPSVIDHLKILSLALGSAIGITFLNVIFIESKGS